MPDTVSKTDNFLKAIEKYAEEQRGKLRTEAEEFQERELNNAEEEGLKEAYDLMQKEMADINNEISGNLSKAEADSRKRIFERRKEIENEVFEKARKKLVEFTDTDKYSAMLSESAKNISSVLKNEDVVLYVRERDLRFTDSLKASFGRKCEVAASDSIKIGGITGLSRSMGLVADETLDTKLAYQREWFYEHSGLTVVEK